MYDVSNPVFSLAIVDDDNNVRIPLWLKSTEVRVPSGMELPPLAVVTDLTVELQLGLLPKITANLSLPHEDGVKLLDSKAIVWGRSRLEVIFGYVFGEGSDLSPVYTGQLLEPDVQLGATELSITLSATPMVPSFASRVSVGFRSDIIRELLTTNTVDEWLVPVDFSEVEKLKAGAPAFDALFKTEVTVAFGYTSAWVVAQKLVHDAQCWSFHDGKKLRVFALAERYKAAPRHILRAMPAPGTWDEGVWPILGFNSPTAGAFYFGLSKGLFHKGIDSATGKPVAVVVEGTDATKDQKQPNLGTGKNPKEGKSTSKVNRKTGDGAEPHHQDQLDEKSKEEARGKQAAAEAEYGTKVEIDTLSIPNIIPGELIRVQGMSQYYDFSYGVYVVLHTFNGSGSSTRLDCFTNSAGVTDAAVKRLGETGDTPPDTSTQDTKQAQNGA